MNRSHRKYHFIIWHILAVFLPSVFVMAILFRPYNPFSGDKNGNTLSATLDTDTDSTSIITVNVGEINGPSCVVILSTATREVVLGTLHQPGTYQFLIPSVAQPATLKLRDAIHKKSIGSIQLVQKN